MLKQTFEELVASQMTFEEIKAEYGEEVAINVGIARDPDAPELDEEWFRRARPAAEVVPHIVERWRRTRGKQKAPTKEPISIRLDSDILVYYALPGKGGRAASTRRSASTSPAQRNQRRRSKGPVRTLTRSDTSAPPRRAAGVGVPGPAVPAQVRGLRERGTIPLSRVP